MYSLSRLCLWSSLQRTLKTWKIIFDKISQKSGYCTVSIILCRNYLWKKTIESLFFIWKLLKSCKRYLVNNLYCFSDFYVKRWREIGNSTVEYDLCSEFSCAIYTNWLELDLALTRSAIYLNRLQYLDRKNFSNHPLDGVN